MFSSGCQKESSPTLSIALSAEVNHLASRCESTVLPVASDPTIGKYSSNFVMDPSNAELIQRHLHEQRGRIGEI